MTWAVLVAALVAVVIFGGSAVATRIAASAISAIDVSIMRTVIGGLIAMPLAVALRIGLPVSVQQRWLLPLSGFCGFIALPLLFTLGVNLTSANHATMILAYILWYWALGTGGIAQVGLFQFLQPVSGVIFAWLILSENLSLIFVLASSIIMLGVVLAFRSR